MISEQQQQQYQKSGYIIVRNALNLEATALLKNRVKALFGDASLSDTQFGYSLFEQFKHSFESFLGAASAANHLPEFHALSVSSSLTNILRSMNIEPIICARPLMWFHNSQLAKSDNYFKLPAHQEWSNMQGSISGIVVWSPLVEITEEMGFLQVITGSHLNGLMPIKGYENSNYPLEIDHEFTDSEFTNVKLNVGDILLFHPLLVHRSGINTSDKIRWTINFRFNNSLDKEFIKQNFFNPFTYQAPSNLKTNLLPTKESVLSSLNLQFNKE